MTKTLNNAPPQRPNAPQLKKIGVTLDTSFPAAFMKCDRCGQSWGSERRDGGKLPRGYWICPNGCNKPS